MDKSDSHSSSESVHPPPHVHFSEEQLISHDSHIVVKETTPDQRDIHLGFLQFRHHYDIELHLPNSLGADATADPLQNLHVSLKQATPSKDGNGHDMVFSFFTHREKLMKEVLVLKSASDAEKKLTIVFHARVLGKGKGTPSLREGIHCTKVDWDDESEASDFQGY